AISIAADYEILQENRPANQFIYGVPSNTQRGPVATGGTPWALAAAPSDWLELDGLKFEQQPDESGEVDASGEKKKNNWLKLLLGLGTLLGGAYLAWRFLNEITDIVEVTLTISPFGKGEGLLPGESGFVERPLPDGLDESKLKVNRNGVDDYNPHRVMTANWKVVDIRSGLGQWEIGGKIIEQLVPNNQFPYMELLNLTTGQDYHWGIEAKSLNHGTIRQFDGEFRLPLQTPNSEPASSYTTVTFLTPDGVAFDKNGLASAREIADSIVDNIDGQGTKGTVMQYLPSSSSWQVLSGDKALGKPLVLIADWSQDSTADKFNSGFAEAAADSLFASLVSLNSSYGTTEELVNALFNSPLHFIGFGRGAVVNSEIIQRLGTFFPKDKYPDMFPDLQMTTVDPNDFQQNFGGINNYYDPQIQVWENVTFADNYYQTATTFNPRGRDIPNTDLSIYLGGYDEAGNLFDFSRAGFTKDVVDGNNPHGRTKAWYGGTVNLSWSKDNPLGYPIHRRQGDFSYGELFDKQFPDALAWYLPYLPGPGADPIGLPPITPPFPNTLAPLLQQEGVATGWYYSVLGGGYKKREFLPPKEGERVPVYFDNTYEERMRGDFAVPTVFNGNFDAIKNKIDNQPIPGWSFDNRSGESSSASTNNSLTAENLKDWRDIPKLSNYMTRLGIDPNHPNYQPNYAVELKNNDKFTHNPMLMPDWGSLRFNLFVPEGVKKDGGQLKVTIQPVNSELNSLTQTILLEDVDFATDTYGNNDISKDADRKLGYGSGNAATFGFETFTLEVPIESQLQNKEVTISFEVTNGSNELLVYLDDVFFQSEHLRFGIPTPLEGNPKAATRKEARYSIAEFSTNLYKDELLLERPQYALSYNGEKNTANWASWLVNKTWIYQNGDPFLADKRNFRPDTNLPTDFHQVQSGDYDPAPVLENLIYAQGHLVPVAHRNRPDNKNNQSKNNLAISLLSNIVPQEERHNRGLWKKIETYANSFAKNVNKNYEVYVISGTDGVKKLSDGQEAEIPSTDPNIPSTRPIKIPEYLWSVLMVIESPGADANINTYTVGFLTVNRPATREELDWNKGNNWETSTIVHSVDYIEKFTGYDFFSNIAKDIQDEIEKNRRILSESTIPDGFVPDPGSEPDERPPELNPPSTTYADVDPNTDPDSDL
ncbi:DNA/RNA non-specific endonuclease, partial [Ancylothrix sp. C2]|uniref:DNA/RNA non-specific endonuclease n=1 Tax=Ancylothrix sp. D3o TaxID=2953691 RepID=UPI0021BB1C7F